jgi:hypothetical protein
MGCRNCPPVYQLVAQIEKSAPWRTRALVAAWGGVAGRSDMLPSTFADHSERTFHIGRGRNVVAPCIANRMRRCTGLQGRRGRPGNARPHDDSSLH